MPITPNIQQKLKDFLQAVAADSPVMTAKMQARLAVMNERRIAHGEAAWSMADWILFILRRTALQADISLLETEAQKEEQAASAQRLGQRIKDGVQELEDTL